MARDFTYQKLSEQDKAAIVEDEILRLERLHYQRRIQRQQLVDRDVADKDQRLAKLDAQIAQIERDHAAAVKMRDKPSG